MTVVAFPIHREAKRVRQVARALISREKRLAQKYFNVECGRLEDRLRAAGIPHDVVEAELDQFTTAVLTEISRLRGDQQGGVA